MVAATVIYTVYMYMHNVVLCQRCDAVFRLSGLIDICYPDFGRISVFRKRASLDELLSMNSAVGVRKCVRNIGYFSV